MTSNDWQESDEALLQVLTQALHTPDPTPASVREAARAVYTWRTIEAELAELVHDSRVDELAMAGLRAEEADLRTLSFESSTLTIELGVSTTALLGQLVPPGPTEVTVHREGSAAYSVPVDPDGTFRIAPPPTGLITLTCADVVTAAFHL
ncbi:hypothetical protein [Winogradskya humida]|uniref:Uncharacterized protein n=1 Tax=Winogradskya humida TaxID=113566 RepID=A0ABQ4A321_9ACTN|nr:hypothetical protein [Actinoplanes humidus]GIE24742.1 hypothetical protein Ahu01nite_078440 [Actinoplanes humidus]